MSEPIELNGKKYELVPVILRSSDGDNEFVHLDQSENLYRLKPLKEAEKKTGYSLHFGGLEGGTWDLIYQNLTLTPTTAKLVAESLEALVEYIQYPEDASTLYLTKVAKNAREAFKEEQDDQ